jgi:hypothetical protein
MANIKLKELLEANINPKLVARSKKTGKLVYFKSPEAKAAAVKGGSHEEPKKDKAAQSKQAKASADMFKGDYEKERGAGNKKASSKTSFAGLGSKKITKSFADYMDKTHPEITDKWGDDEGSIDSKSGDYYIKAVPHGNKGLEISMYTRAENNDRERFLRQTKGPGKVKSWGVAPTLEKAVDTYKKALGSKEWASYKKK